MTAALVDDPLALIVGCLTIAGTALITFAAYWMSRR